MGDLISKKTRIEFREYFTALYLAQIDEEFASAGITEDTGYQPPVSGQRRSLVERYYRTIDFTDWQDVRKVLRVYENVLFALEQRAKNASDGRDDYAESMFAKLKRWMERDGFVYSEGRIVPSAQNAMMEGLLRMFSGLDAQTLYQQIDRLKNSIDEDPALAIGTAKEMIETTCKMIISNAGGEVDESWDTSRLVKETRKLLRLVPEDIPNTAKGAEIIQKIISSLGQITQGIAELRNLYGTGHGKGGRAKGLGPRHARLIVACSAALCTFFFETYQARQRELSISR
jgi:hypothetical protein